MAKLGNLVVDLLLNSSRFDGSMTKSRRQVKSFEQVTTESFRKAAKAIAGLGVGYAAFKALQDGINTTKQFNTAVSDLSAITGATGQDLKFLADQAKEFGSTTTLSATQAAEAIKLIASAKPDLLENKEALAAVTKEAITLAEASGSTLPEAANTLGSALNQFNADAAESARFINVLAAGAKFGASEIADTAAALKASGTVASAAGISFETLNASIQSLSTVAIKGQQAGVSLRNIILSLQKEAVDEFNPAVVGLEQAMKNLNAANLEQTELMRIFGRENVTAAGALINNANSLDELRTKLTGTSTAYEQAAIKVDNLEGDIKGLASAYEGLQITLADKTTPSLREFVQAMTLVTKALDDYFNSASEAESKTSIITDAIIGLSKFLFTLAKEFDDLIDLTKAWANVLIAATALDIETMVEVINARKQAREETEKEIQAFYDRLDALKKNADEEKRLRDERAASGAPTPAGDTSATGDPAQGAATKVKETAAAYDELDMALDLVIQQFDALDQEYAKQIAGLNDIEDSAKNAEKGQRDLERVANSMLSVEDRLAQAYIKRAQIIRDNVQDEEQARHMQLQLAQQYEESITALQEREALKRRRIQEQENASRYRNTASIMGSLSRLVEQRNREDFKNYKRFARAQTIIATAGAVMKEYQKGGYLAAIAAGLYGAAQLETINRQRYDSGGGSVSTSTGAAGGGVVSPSVPITDIPTVSSSDQQHQQPQAQRVVNIYVDSLVTEEVFRRDLLPLVAEAVQDDDVEIITVESRNGQNLIRAANQ